MRTILIALLCVMFTACHREAAITKTTKAAAKTTATVHAGQWPAAVAGSPTASTILVDCINYPEFCASTAVTGTVTTTTVLVPQRTIYECMRPACVSPSMPDGWIVKLCSKGQYLDDHGNCVTPPRKPRKTE